MTMKNTIKRILLAVLMILAFFVLAFVVIIGILTIKEYKPEPVEQVMVQGESSKTIKLGDDINLVSWNIGYGGLDETADFFMDGGTHVNADSKAKIEENMQAIAKQLQAMNPDAVFLQEVDLDSKRSYHVNEQEYLLDYLTDYQDTFAYNYKVWYVPYPFPNIGKVDCGLVSLSKYQVEDASRISLPCPFSYPTRVGNLKRCLLVNRIPIEGSDKDLVLVNLHLEAYDNGEGKIAQTKQLIDVLQSEVDAGNYVIAAGDFNQTFSDVDTMAFPTISDDMWVPGLIEVDDFGKDFSLLMDGTKPSCRSLDKAYVGKAGPGFQYYIIDGFIVSNNLEIKEMQTVDLDFKNSDHNPISLKVSIPN